MRGSWFRWVGILIFLFAYYRWREALSVWPFMIAAIPYFFALSWLETLIVEAPQIPAFEHPVFGTIQPSYRPKGEPWLWETLHKIKTARGQVSVGCDAGPGGPSKGQVEFWMWLTHSIDEVVESARQLLSVEIQNWNRAPLSPDPWRQLTWVGAGLPVRGDRNAEWDVSFELKSMPGTMLTVNFEAGEPQFVTVDD
jgi:hypothetical protein